jgi:hypothetical protein
MSYIFLFCFLKALLHEQLTKLPYNDISQILKHRVDGVRRMASHATLPLCKQL